MSVLRISLCNFLPDSSICLRFKRAGSESLWVTNGRNEENTNKSMSSPSMCLNTTLIGPHLISASSYPQKPCCMIINLLFKLERSRGWEVCNVSSEFFLFFFFCFQTLDAPLIWLDVLILIIRASFVSSEAFTGLDCFGKMIFNRS